MPILKRKDYSMSVGQSSRLITWLRNQESSKVSEFVASSEPNPLRPDADGEGSWEMFGANVDGGPV